jgi:hypothetical protein
VLIQRRSFTAELALMEVGRRNLNPEALFLLDGFPYPVYPKIFPALTPSEFER